MHKFKNFVLVIISTLVLANCGGGGGGGSEPAPVPVPTPAPAMDFSYEAPETLNDYQPFEITVTPSNLQTGETVEVTVEDVDNQILFLNISENSITGRAPFTYTSVDLDFDIKLTSSNSRTATKSVSIPVSFRNVAAERFNTSDDLLAFNPPPEIESILQNENYAVWDFMPMLRGERKKVPEGTYCYPTPDICSYNEGEWPPGYIPADILAGDFDGDGDQDVLYVADIGDRVFKSLGSDEDKTYWSSIHLLFNDGTGRLSEDFSKYENEVLPRLPAPYRVEVEDFNSDGIDDAIIGSFGVPKMYENNTNYWDPYPHLLLLSEDGVHKSIYISQNEPELQEDPRTEVAFAHDASAGDVDGDGNIDIFMNAVLYYGDGLGNFDIVNLNQKEYTDQWGTGKVKVAKTHAHASTVGDYNADGVDDLVILWSNKATPEDEWGAENWTSILMGPVSKDNPIYLDSDQWKQLPPPYYGDTNSNYNDAESGDLNGDGFEDIAIASTRKDPYYAGRHVQILISNGDGTFNDETETRFANQPRAGLDESLQGTGIGEGNIWLRDIDGDGDLDIIDTTGIYGGDDFAIYPRVTLALNDGTGVFEEVPFDYFPKRMAWTYLDKYRGWGFDGPDLIHRSGVVDLDGEGYLDFVSSLQGTMSRVTEDDSEFKQESIVTTQTYISKKKPVSDN